MANTNIQLKKSGATGNVPPSLAYGELALNYADGRLYYKNASGTITYIQSGTSANSFATINSNSSLILATSAVDTLSFVAGNNISISTDTINKKITISSTATSNGGGGGTTTIYANAVSFVISDDVYVGDGSTTSFSLTSTPTNIYCVLVNINGVLQLTSSYTLASNVLTFSEAPASGATIEIKTTQGVTTGDVNSAISLAQAAFNKANTDFDAITIIQGVDVGQNNTIVAVNQFAQSAYNAANAAGSSSYVQSAFDKANTASANTIIIQGVDVTQNTRIGSIETINTNQNTTIGIIQGVDLTQNTRLDGIEGTNLTQNTNITTANNAAWAAFTKANNALANTTGTFAGDLTVTGNVTVSNIYGTAANTSIVAGNYTTTFDNAGKLTLPGMIVFADATTQNTAFTGNAIDSFARTTANGANGLAAGAYNQANVTIGVDVTQNTNITTANNAAWAAFAAGNTNATNITSVNQYAASAYAQANVTIGVDVTQNTRIQSIETINTNQNTTIGIIQSVDVTQNTRLDGIEGTNLTQNTNITTANNAAWAAYAAGNTNATNITSVNQFAQSAYNKANTAITTSGGSITGSLSVSQDLSISGNLTVLGNVTTLTTSTLDIGDSLIYLANNNLTSDIVDIGFIGHYNDGANAHTGIVRDPNLKEWIFFKGYTPEVQSNNLINIAHPSFAYANAYAGYFKGNVIGTTVVVGGIDVRSVQDTQNTNITAVNQFAQSGYNTANNALANTGSLITVNGASQLYVSNTTSSISNTTGALVVNGGVGITGNLFMSAANNISSTTYGSSYRLGWTDNYFFRDDRYSGVSFNGNYFNFNSQLIASAGLTPRNVIYNDSGNNTVVFAGRSGVLLQNNYPSTSNTTGALVVSGGLGVSGNVFATNVFAGSNGTEYNRSAVGAFKRDSTTNYTDLVVINSAVGSGGSRISQITGTGNSYLDAALSDGNGTPIYIWGFGSAVNNARYTFGGFEQFRITNTASAVNYLQVTGNTTGNGPVLSSQGSDANVDINLLTKGTGNLFVNGPNGTSLKVLPPTSSSSNWLQVGNPATTVIRLGPAGTTVADFRLLSPSFTTFWTGSSADGLSEGYKQFHIAGTTSAVNYLQVTGGVTGSGATISAQGSDANVSLNLTSKGTGNVNLTAANTVVSGNLIATAVYTNGLFYANGTPYSTGGGSSVTLSDSVSSNSSTTAATSNAVLIAVSTALAYSIALG